MEKRKFSRTGFHTSGVVTLKGKKTEVSVVDLSLKGALFLTPEPFSADEEVELEIKLSNSEVSIKTRGSIVHREGDHYGVRFTSIDAESMIHLRSLMEYNTENYERIGTELGFLYQSGENKPD